MPLSLGISITASMFSTFHALQSGCLEVHLVSKVLFSCSGTPVWLQLPRVAVVAPGHLGELWLCLSPQQGSWWEKQGPAQGQAFEWGEGLVEEQIHVEAGFYSKNRS